MDRCVVEGRRASFATKAVMCVGAFGLIGLRETYLQPEDQVGGMRYLESLEEHLAASRPTGILTALPAGSELDSTSVILRCPLALSYTMEEVVY